MPRIQKSFARLKQKQFKEVLRLCNVYYREAQRCKKAKAYLAGSFPLSLDSTQRIAGVLVQMQTDGLGIDYLDRRASLIRGVTLDAARAVARRLYDPARLSFAVVGDPAGLESTRPSRAPSQPWAPASSRPSA